MICASVPGLKAFFTRFLPAALLSTAKRSKQLPGHGNPWHRKASFRRGTGGVKASEISPLSAASRDNTTTPSSDNFSADVERDGEMWLPPSPASASERRNGKSKMDIKVQQTFEMRRTMFDETDDDKSEKELVLGHAGSHAGKGFGW
ncbi:hypothetical protein B0H66DRAFT_528053 [Apodospora peruviana]|uniref:Uncharacterized protein n=1 Tax=Apodospora peruviana TaxID=516989 RepID=A0AAE0MFV5_9PEZI|nr:hypothetical protein B0H66DRAFT_528053 [Apodospora peruviana]